VFLSDRLVASTNRYVKNGPADTLPVFRRKVTGLVEVRGSILRYSSTSPEAK
jgi:hypothetical protein